MLDHLELPRPLLLARTIAWNLTESLGLPLAALVIGGWLYGRNAGLVAALVATWLTVAIRKVATGSVPGLLTISALVLTLQTGMVLATGQLWIYLLQFPVAQLAMSLLFARTARGPSPLVARLAAEMLALRHPAGHHPHLHRFFQHATWLWAAVFFLITVALSILMVTEPVRTFILASTEVTVGLTAVGIVVSAWWFRSVLRQSGLRLRFATPQP
ncbi:MAG TPA: hypothetical protein VGS19_03440 [Streptosporangiaceae bacterium]|nr:hypothetical protein [Streptosporangiaceae bacterium]